MTRSVTVLFFILVLNNLAEGTEVGRIIKAGKKVVNSFKKKVQTKQEFVDVAASFENAPTTKQVLSLESEPAQHSRNDPGPPQRGFVYQEKFEKRPQFFASRQQSKPRESFQHSDPKSNFDYAPQQQYQRGYQQNLENAQQQDLSQEPDDVYLWDYENEESVRNCVKINGLSWGTTRADVAEFFRDFGVWEHDIILDRRKGKNTGYGLVRLRDTRERDRAIRQLHKQYLGKRYMNVFAPVLKGTNLQFDEDKRPVNEISEDSALYPLMQRIKPVAVDEFTTQYIQVDFEHNDERYKVIRGFRGQDTHALSHYQIFGKFRDEIKANGEVELLNPKDQLSNYLYKFKENGEERAFKMKIKGGGVILRSPEKINVKGTSKQFGRADHYFTWKLLKQQMPKMEITYLRKATIDYK